MKKHQPVDGIWKDDLYVQTLNQDIKDCTFRPIYPLFGKKAFLKRSYKSRLREVLTGGDTMNYDYSERKGMNVNKIIGLADTMPFFTERHLILMENSGFFKGGTGANELTEYMGGIPESTCLIFMESEADKKNRLYKAMEKYGYAVKLSHQELAQFTRWVADILSKNSRKTTSRTMEPFLSKTGDDMENIGLELEKLIGYTLGREVVINEDMETICVTQIINKIFDMITAITARQAHRTMDLYEGLLMLKEPPMRILFFIARQFDQILQVRDLMGREMDKNTIASRLKLQPFVAGKIMLQAETFTGEQILSYVDLCMDAEGDVKTGKLQDRLAVELLIANKYE